MRRAPTSTKNANRILGALRAVLAEGYGTADRGHDLPIKTQTIFDIGSLGKQFIAAGVLLLESRGGSIAERSAAMIDELGPFANSEALGAVLVSESNGRVVVRTTFERGERLIQMTWSGRRIVHFAEVDQLPSRECLSIEDGAFAAYDIFTNGSATVRFEPAADGEARLRIVAEQSKHIVQPTPVA